MSNQSAGFHLFFECAGSAANCAVYAGSSPYTGSSQRGFANFQVDVEEMKAPAEGSTRKGGPRAILLALGNQFLLRNSYFPNVQYSAGNDVSNAIDMGGVRRDFITRLTESLFSPKFPKEQVLELDKEIGVPLFIERENELDCYKTLGQLFGRCYRRESDFKMALDLNEPFYEALKSSYELGSAPWFAIHYSQLRSAQGVDSLLYPKGEIAPMGKKQLTNLYYLYLEIMDLEKGVLSSAEPSLEELTTFFQSSLHCDKFREALVEKAKAKLQATLVIAQAMRSYLGATPEPALCEVSPLQLKEQIEGRLLTVEAIKGHLIWKSTPTVTPNEETWSKQILHSWIDNASDENRCRFVRAVSANNTLGTTKLRVDLAHRGRDHIPTCHTCSTSIDLSVDCPDQATFDRKMELLLCETSAGHGMSIA